MNIDLDDIVAYGFGIAPISKLRIVSEKINMYNILHINNNEKAP